MRSHDLRFAVRHLVRRPLFALTAVTLLALGAGANAAVFSVVRAVLLRPLPFAAPDRLVALWPDTFVSNEDIQFWRERVPSLTAVAGVSPGWLMALVAEGGEPLKITGARVTGNLFETLGTPAALGRALEHADGTPGRERVTVLSDRLWRQRFAADPRVLGRSVVIDGQPHEVVGVMPAGFELLGERTDLWVPQPFAPGTPVQRNTYSLALGRLRAGATPESATSDLRSVVPEMRQAFARPDDWGRTVHAASLLDVTTGPVRPALLLLFAAVGLVLLLGAANLGTLVLGRSIERARELAVRSAVGASRGDVLRQLIAEQVVLGVVGALLGLGLARVLLPGLIAAMPADVPRQAEIGLDVTVFVAVLAVSIALTVATAIVPALVAVRPGLQPLLRQHTSTDTPGRQRVLGGLVAAQVALAVVLGIGAGLMLRSMWHLQHVDPGFEPRGVLAFRLQSTSKYRTLATGLPYLQQVGDRLAALPGVTAVGAAGHLPLSGYSWKSPVRRADRPVAAGETVPTVGWRFIWRDYLQVMRMPVLAGRAFTPQDRTGSAPVALVNERLARTYFGSTDAALGQRLVQSGVGGAGETTVEIVGIVGDVRHDALDKPAIAEIFRPLEQTFMFPMHLVLRTSGDPSALAGDVRRIAYDVDATVPVAELQPLTALLSGTLGRPRLLAFLLTVFAAAGLLLSIVGLYGVVAVRVRQREREIGIRMALGASAGRMAGNVVTHGLVHAMTGVAIGVPIALGLGRFMESQVFGVTTRDPLTFTLLPLALTMVAVAACYLPARRAAKVDPVVAIRSEGI